MLNVLLVFVGAGLGGVLRYGLSGWLQQLTRSPFPVGTLAVNVIGCVVIGFVGAVIAGPAVARDAHRLLLIAGILGGFTTFSAFGYETMQLLGDRAFVAAALNLVLSNGLGLAAVWLGARVAGAI